MILPGILDGLWIKAVWNCLTSFNLSKLHQVQISSKFITEHKVLFCASTLYHLSVSVLRWHIWWFVSNFPKLSDKFQNCFHRVHYIQHLMMDIWCRAKSVSSPSLALHWPHDTERGISHPGSKGWNVFDICLVLVRSVWWGRVSGDECTEGKFDVPGGPGHDNTDNGDTVVTSSHRGGKRGHWWQYWHFSLQRRVPERYIDNRDMEQVPSEDNKHGFKETHW